MFKLEPDIGTKDTVSSAVREDEFFCLRDIFDMGVARLQKIKFSLEFEGSKEYYSVSKQVLNANNASFVVLRILDVTVQAKCDKLMMQSHFLQMINATVSHEMRNPINAIKGQALRLKLLVK